MNFYAPRDFWNNKQTFTYDMDMKSEYTNAMQLLIFVINKIDSIMF